VLSDSGGSWLAGRDGPAGMIMPAAPAVGDVYRPENVPGLVFEEDTVTSVSEPIETPSGPAADGLAIEEHTQEGSSEIKIYAKGYGEFGISTEDEVLTVAIASPIDATGGPAPPELETIDSSAGDVLDAATEDDWEGANEALGELSGAWATVSPGVPAVLAAEVSATIDALVAAVAAEDASSAQQAAIDVALAGLDVQLRHRPAPDIDIERIEHWANRILVDAEDDEPLAAIRSDIAIIESIWARASGAVGGDVAAIVDGQLAELRVAADAGDVDAAIAGTEALLRTYDGLG
jgi:hypothetical protein